MSCPFLCKNRDKHEKDFVRGSSKNDLGKERASLCGVSHIGNPGGDEHFITIIHQIYELWFKLLVSDVDSVREMLSTNMLDEHKMITLVSRTARMNEILKLMCDQFIALDTVSPQDLLDFRQNNVDTSTNIQSGQFRLLEIKFGVREDLTISGTEKNQQARFSEEDRKAIEKAQQGNSLLDLVDQWLSRTPGVDPNGYNFIEKFKIGASAMLENLRLKAEQESDEFTREHKLKNFENQRNLFSTVFDEEKHNTLVRAGNRRFSHKALQGTFMIFFYRDEPRFHAAFNFLTNLSNIDETLTKWRYTHMCTVQRLAGSIANYGHSYLRSTCSDRYRVFLDLVNFSAFLIERKWIPPLDDDMRQTLRVYKT